MSNHSDQQTNTDNSLQVDLNQPTTVTRCPSTSSIASSHLFQQSHHYGYPHAQLAASYSYHPLLSFRPPFSMGTNTVTVGYSILEQVVPSQTQPSSASTLASQSAVPSLPHTHMISASSHSSVDMGSVDLHQDDHDQSSNQTTTITSGTSQFLDQFSFRPVVTNTAVSYEHPQPYNQLNRVGNFYPFPTFPGCRFPLYQGVFPLLHASRGIDTSIQSIPEQVNPSQVQLNIPAVASQTNDCQSTQGMLTHFQLDVDALRSSNQTKPPVSSKTQDSSLEQTDQSEPESFLRSHNPQPPVRKKRRKLSVQSPENSSLGLGTSGNASCAILSPAPPHESSLLSSENISLVYETVYSAHPKWYNFGLALGVPAYALDSINLKCLADSSKCFRETILTRLRKKKLTWNEIITALRSFTVGETELARRLLKRKHCHCAEITPLEQMKLALSGEVKREELFALPVEDVWYPLGLWLGVEEKKLREMKKQSRGNSVQAVFNEFLSIRKLDIFRSQEYTELMDSLPDEKGKQAHELIKEKDTDKFRDFIQYSDLSREIIPLAVKLIEMMSSNNTLLRALIKVGKRNIAQKICSKKGVSLTDYLDATDPTSNPPDYVLRYASYLKDLYRHMSVVPDPEWPPALASTNHYTNLALITRERNSTPRERDINEMASDYAHGKIDKIVASKESVQLEEAFFPIINPDTNDSRLTILMDGAPGVGKTTITRKLCIDWARSNILQGYQIVILVPLRELKIAQSELKSLADLILADDLMLKDQVSKYLLETSGVGTLFIFDGYDELGFEERALLQRSLFVDIIKGRKLHRCSVLVTSRPYASGPLRGLNQVNRHIEVLGFTEQQIADCVSMNLSDKEGKQLLKSLKQRLDISSLCYIPLNCRIVLFVYTQEDFKLPATLTKLYEIFILHTIKHYAPKITSDSLVLQRISMVRNLDSLPNDILAQLSDLCYLAFSGMEKDNLVFDSLEIGESHDYLSLGVMTSLHGFSTTGVLEHFQFLHLTIQEFLAARYLASNALSTEETRQFMKTNIANERFRMTLLFLAGLTHFNFLLPNECLLIDKTSYLSGGDRKEKLLFLAQLIYESKSSSVQILPALNRRLDMSYHHLTMFDHLVLAYFLSATPEDHVWEVINFAGCGLANGSILLTQKHFSNPTIPAIAMTKKLILLDDGTFAISAVTAIISASSESPLKEFLISPLQMANCEHVVNFSRAVANHQNLNKVQNHQVQPDLVIYKRVLSLANEDSRQNLKICSKSFQLLLKYMTADKVKVIDLSNHAKAFEDCSKCASLGRDAVQSLCETLKRSECIQKVNLKRCKLADEAAVSVIASLSDKKSQVDVNMEGSKVSSSGLVSIQSNLHTNIHCRVLGIALYVDEDIVLHLKHHTTHQYGDTHLSYLIENISSRIRGFGVDVNYISKKLMLSLTQAKKSMLYLKLNSLAPTNQYVVPKLRKVLSHVSPKQLYFSRCTVFSRRGTDGPQITSVTKNVQTMLETSKSLQVVTLSHCEVSDIVVNHIVAGLTHNTSLLELDISSNHLISTHGWNQLFNTLKMGPASLQKLDISKNKLDSENSTSLCEMLRLHKTLTALRLSQCSINDCSMETLVGGLSLNTSLREIDINCNDEITSKGWSLFFQALQSTLINTIDMSYNKFGEEGLSALREFLHQNVTITVFRASWCDLTDDVVIEIADNLSHKSLLRELDIHSNQLITSKGLVPLLKALQRNISLRKFTPYQAFSTQYAYKVTARALSEMITCNKGITELAICEGFIQGEYEMIAQALLRNITLQILRLYFQFHTKTPTLEETVDGLRNEKTCVFPDWNLKIVHC